MVYDTPSVTPEVLLCSHVSPGKMTNSEYVIFMIFLKQIGICHSPRREQMLNSKTIQFNNTVKGLGISIIETTLCMVIFAQGSSYSENPTDKSMYIYSYIAYVRIK